MLLTLFEFGWAETELFGNKYQETHQSSVTVNKTKGVKPKGVDSHTFIRRVLISVTV